MQHARSSYVFRGDRERRKMRVRRALVIIGFIGSIAVLANERMRDANASAAPLSFRSASESERLRGELDATKGELELVRSQLERAKRIIDFSGTYKVRADLAATIHDIALAEGIEPELAFRLVNVESQFNERATSPVGAVGLTQLMPSTARFFQKGITREQLYNRETNLRIGFRYLRALIRENKGDVTLALLVYNRGPVVVRNLRSLGVNPANGYERAVAGGYTGTGVVE
jgi:soluble lytic murein transglycosylase-like protein